MLPIMEGLEFWDVSAVPTKQKLLIVDALFFSSRRRHTRSLCDWSSDVYSSDLVRRHRREFGEQRATELEREQLDELGEHRAGEGARPGARPALRLWQHPAQERQRRDRSEERRVGKAWRDRWSSEH